MMPGDEIKPTAEKRRPVAGQGETQPHAAARRCVSVSTATEGSEDSPSIPKIDTGTRIDDVEVDLAVFAAELDEYDRVL